MLVLSLWTGDGTTIEYGPHVARFTVGRDQDGRVRVGFEGSPDATLDGRATSSTTFGIGDRSTVMIGGKSLVIEYLGRSQGQKRWGFSGPRSVAVLRFDARVREPRQGVA